MAEIERPIALVTCSTERIAAAFASAGGDFAVADGFEELLGRPVGSAASDLVIATA